MRRRGGPAGKTRKELAAPSTGSGSAQRLAAFPHAPSVAGGLVTFFAQTVPDAMQSGLYALPSSRDAAPTPRPIATLRGTNLSYLIASYNSFDGECLAFYGSSDRAGTDGLYVTDPTGANQVALAS